MVTQISSNHVREQGSMLAGAEKAALVWMAQRLPRWIKSDHLTLLGFAGMLLAGAGFCLARRNPLGLPLVVFALGLNWLGDSLDGTLARVRNRQRPRYGFYVDHVLDLVGTFCLVGGLALSGYMNSLLAMAMLAAYLTAAAEEFLATHVRRVFHLSFLGFGPTDCASSSPLAPCTFSTSHGFIWVAWGRSGCSTWAARWPSPAWH